MDLEALLKAFLPDDAARRMLIYAQNFNHENRAVATVKSGDAIVTIMCHAMSQGLCGAIDQLHDYFKADDEWGGGPAEMAYCVAAGKMVADRCSLPMSQLVKAFHNQGGPFMRGGQQ